MRGSRFANKLDQINEDTRTKKVASKNQKCVVIYSLLLEGAKVKFKDITFFLTLDGILIKQYSASGENALTSIIHDIEGTVMIQKMAEEMTEEEYTKVCMDYAMVMT